MKQILSAVVAVAFLSSPVFAAEGNPPAASSADDKAAQQKAAQDKAAQDKAAKKKAQAEAQEKQRQEDIWTHPAKKEGPGVKGTDSTKSDDPGSADTTK